MVGSGLTDLKGAVQTGDKLEDAAAKRMREVITGTFSTYPCLTN